MIKLLDGVGKQGDGFDEQDEEDARLKIKGKGKIKIEEEEEDEDEVDSEQDVDGGEEDPLEIVVKKGGKKKDLPATYQPGLFTSLSRIPIFPRLNSLVFG